MPEADLFYGTRGPRHDADIAIVGEAWGRNEESAQLPFVGQSGQELDRILADAGIDPARCFFTNIISARPPDNDMKHYFYPTAEARKLNSGRLRDLYPRDEIRKSLGRLHSQLQAVGPKVIIAFGNYPLWALTENNFSISDDEGYKVPSGITSWRGSYLDWNTWDDNSTVTVGKVKAPVIPTYHPAAVLRQWAWRTPLVHDLRTRVLPLANGKAVPDPKYSFIIRPTFNEACNSLDDLRKLPKGSLITIDLETRDGHIACIGLATSAKDAICIPLMCTERPEGYFTIIEEMIVRLKLIEHFESGNLRWSNQNILFDLQYLDYWLFSRPKVAFDTMVAHHVCWPGTPKGLDYLSSLYCTYHKYWKDEGRKWDASMPEEQLWRYNCIDAVAAWEITHVLDGLIADLKLRDVFNERLALLDVSLDMMLRGINIDKKERSRQTIEVFEAIQKVEAELETYLPPGLPPLLKGKSPKAKPWYRSPSQQARLFYDFLSIKEVKHGKTKQRTCNDDALIKIAAAEPLVSHIVEKLQYLRSLGVYYSTFLTAALEPDGRMRCSFNVAGPSTFRWSSSENAFWRGTNLQNIPKKVTEE